MRRRSGGLSVVRVSLYVGIFGLLLIGLGVGAFFSDQAARRGPFDVPLYPGALPYGTAVETGNSSRNTFYIVDNATPEDVLTFYQQKMNEHYGDIAEHCVRIPPQGQYPVPEGAENVIAYQFVCLFDHSGFQATQYTRVLIYPGYFNEDPFYNTLGKTIIEYDQQWQV